MNLKIILKDLKYCNGCPCITYHHLKNIGYCGLYGIQSDDMFVELIVSVNGLIRPQKCIDENGE